MVKRVLALGLLGILFSVGGCEAVLGLDKLVGGEAGGATSTGSDHPECGPNGTTQCAGATLVQSCENGAWVTQTDCSVQSSTCAVAPGGVAGCVDCPMPNEVRCPDTQCYDLSSSPANCGACGKACATTDPNGTEACVNSECSLKCNGEYVNCLGTCVAPLASNDANCGGCGNVCVSLNGTNTCTSGACVNDCSPGYMHCVGPASAGCETDIGDDVNNCGACDNVCASLPNVVADGLSCTSGQCTLGPSSCAPGYANCDGSAANGCESQSSSDLHNCGGCASAAGVDCTTLPNVMAGGVACVSGKCVVNTCDSGYIPCGTPASCTSTATDPMNCNGCGNVCALPNVAIDGCSASACTVGTCAAGYADCDMVASDGCEINTTNDPNNCGGCASACWDGAYTAGNFWSCSSSQCICTNTTCTTPGAGIVHNFCTDLQTDRLNCGACNSPCPTPPHGAPYYYACVSGTCVMK
jgi:hypothetical protein